MRFPTLAMTSMAAFAFLSGCEPAKSPQVTAVDIDAARQQAQRDVAEARAEAAKDVKSAAKVSGSDSAVVTEAKVTGSYDIAMAKADGDHTVATAQCLTLDAAAQQTCKERADRDYDTAKAAAKATRVARRQ